MAIKKLCQTVLICIAFFIHTTGQAQNGGLGQTIQINTHFSHIFGKPSWLLIIRNIENNHVLPYIYDIENNNNFWLAFTEGRTYQVTVSTLTFGPYAKIYNFCHLQSCIITGKSMWVTLSGVLSPDPTSFRCHVNQYTDMNFHIAEPQ